MPTPSEFEEKEFETQLAPEMAAGPGQFWTPGQVLEHRTGAEIFLDAANAYFSVVGGPTPMGIPFSDPWLWPFLTSNWSRAGNPPPNFRANVFLQVKRPYRYRRRQGSLKHPCWKFEIYPPQQVRLEAVEKRLAGLAVVSYASPAFDTRGDLFKHARNRQLVPNTTFPSVSALKGHQRWQYDAGGATGIAHSVPVEVTEADLQKRVQSLLGETSESPHESPAQEVVNQLGNLWDGLIAAVEEAGDKELHAYMLELASLIKTSAETPVAVAWARVAVASRLVGLTWLVAGSELP